MSCLVRATMRHPAPSGSSLLLRIEAAAGPVSLRSTPGLEPAGRRTFKHTLHHTYVHAFLHSAFCTEAVKPARQLAKSQVASRGSQMSPRDHGHCRACDPEPRLGMQASDTMNEGLQSIRI